MRHQIVARLHDRIAGDNVDQAATILLLGAVHCAGDAQVDRLKIDVWQYRTAGERRLVLLSVCLRAAEENARFAWENAHVVVYAANQLVSLAAFYFNPLEAIENPIENTGRAAAALIEHAIH